jgi:hypothetical protein
MIRKFPAYSYVVLIHIFMAFFKIHEFKSY